MKLLGLFKTEQHHSPGITKKNLNQFFRWLIIIVLYLAVFYLFDIFSRKFQIFPGVVAWYPPDGISFAFLIVFGPAYAPVVALASVISSLLIYHFDLPLISILAWAAIVSTSYGIITAILRKRRIKGSKSTSARNILIWMGLASIVAALLAIISVINLVQFGSVPVADAFDATVQWLIGEMIGLLVFTPFLLIYIMPWVVRFSQGKRIFTRRKIKFRPDPEVIAQILSMVLVLYLVFGIEPLQKFHLHYLISIPLIWVAMRHGLARTTIAIVLTNIGVMLAIWFFKYQHAQLAEFQFLLFGIFFSVLIIGAFVSRQNESEEDKRKKEVLYRALVENASEAIMLVDVKRVIEYHSPAASRILGFTDTQSQIGLNAALFTHPDDSGMLYRLFEDMIQTPSKIAVAQYRVRHQNGEWI